MVAVLVATATPAPAPAYTVDPDLPLCYTEADVVDIAKVLYRECRGQKSRTEQACVAWVICNRADARNATIHDVVRAPGQFAWNEDTPVLDDLYELAEDVLIRWDSEHRGGVLVGRVLPREYQWFHGAEGHNWFKSAYKGGAIWDYSLESPYRT